MHIHMHMHVHIHIQIRVYICQYIHIYMYIYTYVHIYTYIVHVNNLLNRRIKVEGRFPPNIAVGQKQHQHQSVRRIVPKQ